MKKHNYKTKGIGKLDVVQLSLLLLTGCIIAFDIAKRKMVFAIADAKGTVLELFHFTHHEETREVVARLVDLRRAIERNVEEKHGEGAKVTCAFEPTGTYGDALVCQLRNAGFDLVSVSPKKTHDSASIFDGVPSMHDGKSAVVIAKLVSLGLGTKAPPASEKKRDMRALVEEAQRKSRQLPPLFGHLEALLARHWPELEEWLSVTTQKSSLKLLRQFGGPGAVAKDPQAAKTLLRAASNGALSEEKIAGCLASAAASIGMPMTEEEQNRMKRMSGEVLALIETKEGLEVSMLKVGKADPVFQCLMSMPGLGVLLASALTTIVDITAMHSPRALEKSCGLNLREKSSGEFKGRLSITKRGSPHVRQLMYMFALRMIASDAVVQAWYVKRRGYTEDSKTRAVVAVMRKLLRGVFHVAKGQVFDATKLFDVRRLDVDKHNEMMAKKQEARQKKSPAKAAPSSDVRPAPLTSS